MNKTLTIAAITLVAVVIGMSAVAPAMAVPPSGSEHSRCAALDDAYDNAGSDTAKAAIQKNLEKLGCIEENPCGTNSSVHNTRIDC